MKTAAKETAKKPARIEEVNISRLVALDGRNHRFIDANSPDIKALAQNIKETGGLINPISVRELGDGRLDIIAGFRRYAALNVAGYETAKVCIYDANDSDAYIISVSENFMRQPLTWIEEAKALNLLIDSGKKFKAAAGILGWPESTVRRRAKLISLTEGWLKFIEGNIFPYWTVGHYELIALYSPEIQNDILKDLISNQYHYARYTIAELSSNLAASSRLIKSAPWKADDELLVPSAGSCTACPQRTGATPNLFEDEKSRDQLSFGDRCLNDACWKSKLDANSEIRFAKVKEKHPDIILVREDWNSDDPNILDRRKYADCQKADKRARLAYIVEGENKGQTKYIVPSITTEKTSRALRPKDKDGKPVGPSI